MWKWKYGGLLEKFSCVVLVLILSLKCYPCKDGCVVNNPKYCHPIIMAIFGECNMTLHCFQQQLSLLLCKLEGASKNASKWL